MIETLSIDLSKKDEVKRIRFYLNEFAERGFIPLTSCVIPTRDGAVLLFTLSDIEGDDDEGDSDIIPAKVPESKGNGHDPDIEPATVQTLPEPSIVEGTSAV